MARARGANAVLALAINPGVYGAIPADFIKMPFVDADIGEEQALLESDLLGYGREPQTPSLDVANDDGNVTVPVDLRLFGYWLYMLFGPPISEAVGVAATGSYVFTAQPANNSIITVGGQAFTFVSGAPAANQIKIGATLADTVAGAVQALNASAVVGVAAASYRANLDGDTVLITHDTIGTGGNAMTIVAGSSPDTHATASAATLAGGSGSGPRNNVFASGALNLPDAALEVGFPEVPSYGLNRGVMANTLAISVHVPIGLLRGRVAISVQRSGHLNARIGLIAQGEDRLSAPTDAGPTELVIERFSQWSGGVFLDGVPAGDLVSAELNFNNGLDKVETIRQDGRIGGVDAGMLTASMNIGVRFRDTSILDKATSSTPVEIVLGWQITSAKRLEFKYHRVFLPKPKLPVSGPGGVQANFTAQAARDTTLGRAISVTLVNDVDYTA